MNLFAINRAINLALLAALLGLSGCREAAGVRFPPAPGEPVRTVYVVDHGWHAGLVLRLADLPEGWPALDDFAGAAYLEFGWGDAGYYPHPDPGAGDLLKAGLWPTASVLHVAGLRRPPAQAFPEREVLQVELSREGFDRLAGFVAATFARDAEGAVRARGAGLYGDSRFYAARGRYHVFNNCNHWTARALRAAGCPVTSAYTLTARELLRQVRRFAAGRPGAPATPPSE